jgi:hypothetical protein
VKSVNGQLENNTIGLGQTAGDAERKKMPKLVIGLIRGELAKGLETHFRAMGWRVCSADTCEEVRAKAHGGRASVVVLPVTAFDTESAYLTCAKLVKGLPKARVFLVGPETKANERFAEFAGAAGYIPETATASQLVGLLNAPKAAKPK